jgi:hypothetical protein
MELLQHVVDIYSNNADWTTFISQDNYLIQKFLDLIKHASIDINVGIPNSNSVSNLRYYLNASPVGSTVVGETIAHQWGFDTNCLNPDQIQQDPDNTVRNLNILSEQVNNAYMQSKILRSIKLLETYKKYYGHWDNIKRV